MQATSAMHSQPSPGAAYRARLVERLGDLREELGTESSAGLLRLVADDKATVFGNEAMVSDFPLTDESLCYVTFGPEEAPGE